MKTILEHNLESGEKSEREMTAEELASYEADDLAAIEKAQIEAEKAAEKAALLAKLGITEDEAKLLLS